MPLSGSVRVIIYLAASAVANNMGFGNMISPKSRLVALLLCLFLGWLGVHRFYAGKIGTGLAVKDL